VDWATSNRKGLSIPALFDYLFLAFVNLDRHLRELAWPINLEKTQFKRVLGLEIFLASGMTLESMFPIFPSSYAYVPWTLINHSEMNRIGEAIKRIKSLIKKLFYENETCQLKCLLGARNFSLAGPEFISEQRASELMEGQAEAIIENSDLLTDDILDWLCTEKSRRSSGFFYSLGSKDKDKKLYSKMMRVSQKSEGANIFSHYLGGILAHDPGFVDETLRKSFEECSLNPKAILFTLRFCTPNSKSVTLILEMLKKGDISADELSDFCTSPWIKEIEISLLLKLLASISEEGNRGPILAMRVISMWLHFGNLMDDDLAEFAWGCLESGSAIEINDAYLCNKIAHELASKDIERGFKLFKSLLQKNDVDDRGWNPIERYGAIDNKFYALLKQSDMNKVLGILFISYQKNRLLPFFSDILFDQERDQDVIKTFALESRENAIFIANQLLFEKPGFWQISLEIIRNYTGDREVFEALQSRIRQDSVIIGPYSMYLETRNDRILKLLEDGSLDAVAQRWLRDLNEMLEERINQEKTWEGNYDANG
jgi:hypothetical protein